MDTNSMALSLAGIIVAALYLMRRRTRMNNQD